MTVGEVAKTRHTFCPSCKGTVPRAEGSRAEECPFCHHRSLVVTDRPETLRYRLTPSIDAASALESVKHRLETHRVLSRRQIASATFDQATLYYVPYLWLSGTIPYLIERDIQHPDMRPRVDTKVMIEDVEVFELAVELKGWGLKGFDVGALLAKPHAPMPEPYEGTALRAEGLVLAPQRSFDEGIDWIEAKLARLSPTHHEAPTRRAERRRVLFVPVWSVSYTIDGLRYEARIEAIDGELLSARGPEDERWRVPMALGALILPCFCLGKLVRFGLEHPSVSPVLVGLAHPGVLFVGALGLLFMAFLFLTALAFSWSLIRYEAVQIFRRGRLWSERLGMPGQTTLDRMTAWTGDLLSRLMSGERLS